MINVDWITTSGSAMVSMCLTAIVIYVALLLFTRLSGLRSFSKMSSFDLAITVTVGSILASTILSKTPSLLTGVLALALLYAIQYGVATCRRMSAQTERIIDNEPLVLMAGSEILSANLDTARVTEGDLNSKLRMAGISRYDEILAVILETTGDVSVLRRGKSVDASLFKDVRDRERIPGVATVV